MNTKTIGDKTEARVLSALLEVYPTVLLPFGDNQRYDFVFEDHDGSFKKVQSKTGRYRDGVIIFNTNSHTRVTGGKRLEIGYDGQIDFFGVSCPDFSVVWLVPIEHSSSGKMSLRVDDPAGFRGLHRIKWAKDYLLYDPCK